MFCKDCSRESCGSQCQQGSAHGRWLLKAEVCLPGSRGDRALDSKPGAPHLVP